MNKYDKSEHGIVLPTVLIIMIVVFSFAAITLTYSTSQVKTELKYEQSTKAFHAAETGLHTYLWTLNKENAKIELNKIITYPESNPEYAYVLKSIEDEVNRKKVKSTGWALSNPDVKQTMTVDIDRKSYTAHVYFTNNEENYVIWGDGEVCYGPLRTNNNLYIENEPTFYGKVFYSGQIKVDNKDIGIISQTKYNKIFKKGTKLDTPIKFPENNNDLAVLANSSDGKSYTGRTSIFMREDGWLDIWNAPTNTRETIRIPDNGVIYVNGGEGSTFDIDAGNVFISGKLKGRLTVGAANNIYITDYNPTIENFNNVGAETNGVMYATTTFSNDLVNMTATGADMLGLIANQNVVILTNGWFNKPNVKSAVKDIYIYAAVLAIKGSLSASNNGYTPESNNYNNQIFLRGSLAQQKRGIVGWTPSYNTYKGYRKNYAHDPRLLYNAPPHFLEPKNSGWEIAEWN